MSKYLARKTRVDGLSFDSAGEARRYQDLLLLQRAGTISGLVLQPSFAITLNGVHVCKVVLDFSYIQDGKRVYEDFKGYDTPVSRLKRKLLRAQFGIEVKVTRKTRRRAAL